MGEIHDTLSPELQAWLAQQKVFFVATAPLVADGHLNCSPKGGDASGLEHEEGFQVMRRAPGWMKRPSQSASATSAGISAEGSASAASHC